MDLEVQIEKELAWGLLKEGEGEEGAVEVVEGKEVVVVEEEEEGAEV